MKHAVIFALFCIALAPLHAGTIDVTGDSQVTVQNGESLIVGFGAWSYPSQATNAGLDSPYPAEICFTLGGLPAGLPNSAIPGTSAAYTPGMLFSATLESLDGSISMPLFDSDAAALGLPDGDVVLTTGYRGGGSYTGPISVVSGAVTLSPAEAAALFSGNALNPGSQAFEIRLTNIGENMTFGYSGSPITAAVSASLSSARGTLSLGAMPLQVELQDCPEPGTIGLLLMGLAGIAATQHRNRSRDTNRRE
jgi:hypothetical protein